MRRLAAQWEMAATSATRLLCRTASSPHLQKMGRSQLDGLIRSNPNLRVVGSKRPGTAAGNRFAKYKTATSVQQFFWLGGTRADLKHDIAKGIVTIEGDTESDDDDEDDPSH